MKKQVDKKKNDDNSCDADVLRAQMAEASGKNPDDFETGITQSKKSKKH
ncbi:MAG: hypothetical protein ACYC2T_01400 [Bacillota bacterium]